MQTQEQITVRSVIAAVMNVPVDKLAEVYAIAVSLGVTPAVEADDAELAAENTKWDMLWQSVSTDKAQSWIDGLMAEEYFKARASRSNRKEFLAMLAKVPVVAPAKNDRLPHGYPWKKRAKQEPHP